MSETIVLTCKICGWDFPLRDGELIACCPGCGTAQSRPRVSQDALLDLHRAHKQRCACDFTNAADSYQHVLRVHPDSAEALWGLALCKYGVEYVQDEKSGERLPVVHFLNRRPITEDPDYLLAYAHAAPEDRPGYQRDAAYISRIQQDVLAAEGRGDAWDVFLCYKSSVPGAPDDHTREFIHAQELYIALRDAGYSVFFAHTTLRRAAGANYEAQVFHALQSARAMLVVVSDPAHLNTPWVHSEWSRYLERVDAREDCRLIPLLYDGCNPYALPDAFLRRSIQGLTMGSLTALDDLRGILEERIQRAQQPSAGAAPAVPETSRALLRISMALEDGEWEKAEKLCDALIDEVPDCAQAHLSLLLARLKASDMDALSAGTHPFHEDVCWKRALRFADVELRKQMEACAAQFANAQKARSEAAQIKAEEKLLLEAARRREAIEKQRIEAANKERIEALENARRLADEMQRKEDEKRRQEAEEAARRMEEEKRRKEAEESRRISRNASLLRERLATAPQRNQSIAACESCTIGLNPDGSISAAGYNSAERHIATHWKNIISVAAGKNHTVALHTNGTVATAGVNAYGECDANRWTDITAIAASGYHTVGLHSDGTVVATGYNLSGQCNVKHWRGIVAIAAGHNHTVGLRADGTVVATGTNSHGQCNISEWKSIIAIAAGSHHTIGLRADGTVVAAGDRQAAKCNVSKLDHVVAIAAGENHTVVLRADGTVVSIGNTLYGLHNVSAWTDIVAITAGADHTVGLRSNGSVVAVGKNADGQCNVSAWKLLVPTLPK